jgi:hypothetical protein
MFLSVLFFIDRRWFPTVQGPPAPNCHGGAR